MVVVVQNVWKKNVWFGPVIQVAVTPFHAGKGKAKEQRDALSFLVLSKDHGFVSVILDPTEYDMDTMVNFPNDKVVQEVNQVAEADVFTNDWFQRFVRDCESMLLPKIEEEYLKQVGAPWKNPLKIKIRTPLTDSTSTTPSSSNAKGSEVKGRAVGIRATSSTVEPTTSAGVSLQALVVSTILDQPLPQTTVLEVEDVVGPAVEMEVEVPTAAPLPSAVPEQEDAPTGGEPAVMPSGSQALSVEIVPAQPVERPVERPMRSDAGGSRATATSEVNYFASFWI